jgi:hypothetical protein
MNSLILIIIIFFIYRYTILEEYSGAIITNYKEHSDGYEFRNSLTQGLNQILDILKT